MKPSWKMGKIIVVVDIQRGTDRPYYLAKKGMRPEGVYVRQGYSSVPATDTAIRRMIKETDGDRFEAMRCLNQDLTFEATKKEFELRKTDFGPQQMRTLKLTMRMGYTVTWRCFCQTNASIPLKLRSFRERTRPFSRIVESLPDR